MYAIVMYIWQWHNLYRTGIPEHIKHKI